MDYEIIKDILNIEKISAEEKISMISKIAQKFEAIDNYANEIAFSEGRKVTIDDEHRATMKFASDMGLSLEKDEQEVIENIRGGIFYLVKNQLQNGGWGRSQKERIPERIHAFIKSDHPEALASAWLTTMAIVSLTAWYRFFNKDKDVETSIIKGLKWLKENQDSNGAWRDVDRFVIESPPNVIQTGMAIVGLVYGMIRFDIKDHKVNIDDGMNFLEKMQDKKTGGWPSLSGAPPDSKATSISVLASLFTNRKDLATKGIEWLIDNQNPEGDWGYKLTPDSFLLGIYYGLEALEGYQLLNNAFLLKISDFRLKVNRATQKALNWYVKANKLIKSSDGYNWAFQNEDEIADVANTAAAVTVLLDCAEDDFSFVINKSVEFLLNQKDQSEYWSGDTSIVLLSLIRYVKPESRLFNSLYELINR